MRVELRLHNTLSAKLNISNSGISSGSGGRVIWGNIVGEIENQEDLVAYIDGKGYLTSIPEEYVKRPELDSYQPKGDYLTAIPSEYITETELEGKNYAVKSEIPTTTSALTNDSGYLTEHQDISGLATKEELSDYQIKGNYLTEIPEDYAKKSDIPDTSKFITEIPSEYITETELGDKGYLTSIPSEYITETELNAKGYLTEHQDISGLATKEELSDYQIKGNYLTEIPSEYITETELGDKGYATEAQLTSALGDIESVLDYIIGG